MAPDLPQQATVAQICDPSPPELEGRYANHFQVGYNANECLIDFGQDFGQTPPQIHTRIIIHSRNLGFFLELIRRTASNWQTSEPGNVED